MLKKLQVLWRKTNRWHRVVLVFLVVELRLVPGGQLGFHCNDPALSYAFTGDTVSWKLLIGLSFLLPLAVMLLIERLQHKSGQGKDLALFWYKEYFFGALLNLTVVQALKLAVGSPRPHFFETCQPKEALNCTGSEYVSSYTCTRAHWLSQSDKSFPSGHTSLALHAGVFIAWYLRRRAGGGRAARAGQAGCAGAAAACALSRVADRRHHWPDLAAGAALAAATLAYTIFYLCNNFECVHPSREGNSSIDPHKESRAQRTDEQPAVPDST